MKTLTRLLISGALAVLSGCAGDSGRTVDGYVDGRNPDGLSADALAERDGFGPDGYGRDYAGKDRQGGDDDDGDAFATDHGDRDSRYSHSDAPNPMELYGFDVENIGINPEFSSCGGFGAASDPQQNAGFLCGFERFIWAVHPVTGVITVVLKDIALSCCGEHSIAVEDVDGVFTFTAVDSPLDGDKRCLCECLYDYSVQIPKLEAVEVFFRIQRFRRDIDEKPWGRWEGWFSLDEGSAEVLIDIGAGRCPNDEALGREVAISECGGFDFDGIGESPRCADEWLLWTYDPDADVIRFINTNVWLNCCGRRNAVVIRDPRYGTTIIESDMPTLDNGRCNCNCMRDFVIEVSDGSGGAGEYTIIRSLPDREIPDEVVWNGSIDLDQGFGAILIAKNVGDCR